MKLTTLILSKLTKNFYKINILLYLPLLILIMFWMFFPYTFKFIIINFIELLLIKYIYDCKKNIFYVKNKLFNIYSNTTKNIYNKISTVYLPILYVNLFLLIILNIMFIFDLINFSFIKFILLFTLLILGFIKSYCLNYIVIFSDTKFKVGNNYYNYSDISNIKQFNVHSNILTEPIVSFEIFLHNTYIGFDKFFKSDFDVLCTMINVNNSK